MTTEPKPQGTTVVLTVEDVDYPLDIAEFTGRECGVIKSVGHVKGVNEIPDALDAGDLEVIVALAVVAMRRAGVRVNPETLLDGKAGTIKIGLAETEEEGGDRPTMTEATADTGTPASPESTESIPGE